MSQNPLLFPGGLPPFDKIDPTHIREGMRELLAELASELETLEVRPVQLGMQRSRHRLRWVNDWGERGALSVI
jgi:Zn-dependent oligopeptidase